MNLPQPPTHPNIHRHTQPVTHSEHVHPGARKVPRTQSPDRGAGLGAVPRGLRMALEAVAAGRSQKRDRLGSSTGLGGRMGGDQGCAMEG